jgi:LAO/AO transport system kinase
MSAQEGAAWLAAAKQGDFQAFAKFLTWLERASVRDALGVDEIMQPAKLAFRIGITGPPGAGKSTIVGQLIKYFRSLQMKTGVIAVDPSSPFTHGAILGDRIRYSEHFLDPGVFIRSLGTRGSLGGLSSAAFLMSRAFDACGFDVLLIETVGVGQTELDVLHVADQVCVVLVPESGDSIQAMKAGLMEIADIFVVNKADRPGADGLAREIEASMHDGESAKQVAVLKTTASENKGITELGARFAALQKDPSWRTRRASAERLREEGKALLRAEWERDVKARVGGVSDLKSLRSLFEKK